MLLVELKHNFNKNETESKMENPTHSFRDMNVLCFSSYKNRELKVKLWWIRNYDRKKEFIFRSVYFVRRNSFLTIVFYHNI